MRWIVRGVVLASLLSCVWGCAGGPARTGSYFQIRLASEEERPGYLEARVPDMKKPIYVSPTIELTDADVKWARVLELRPPRMVGAKAERRDRGPGVGIKLTWAASRKLRRLTEEHTGERLAIIVADRVISAPVITGTIRKQMLIYGNFDKEEAELLATILNGNYVPMK